MATVSPKPKRAVKARPIPRPVLAHLQAAALSIVATHLKANETLKVGGLGVFRKKGPGRSVLILSASGGGK